MDRESLLLGSWGYENERTMEEMKMAMMDGGGRVLRSGVRRYQDRMVLMKLKSGVEGRSASKRERERGDSPPPKLIKVEPLDPEEGLNDEEDSDDIPFFRPALTPFELPHVFNEILKHLDLKDWKNSRLVSKPWYEASFDCMKSFQLNITDRQKIKILLSSKSPFARYPTSVVFENVALPDCISLADPMLMRFLDKYGNSIKRLVIPCLWWEIDDLRIVLFEKCTSVEELHLIGKIPGGPNYKRFYNSEMEPQLSLPNLKSVRFDITNAQQEEEHHRAQNNWVQTGPSLAARNFIADFLSAAPNLEWVHCPTRRDVRRDPSLTQRLALKYTSSAGKVEVSFCRINQFLAQKLFSSNHTCNPKILGLTLYLRLNARGMEKLAFKKYPLQSIDLHIRHSDRNGLKELFAAVGGTLKHLRLTVDSRMRFDFSCAPLVALQSLILDEYCGELSFIGQIPEIRSLHLHYFNSSTFIKTPKPSFPESKLTEVIMEKPINPSQQAACLKKLSITFPKISKLSLDLVTDKDLNKIYDCFPHLEELITDSCVATSSAICGLTDADTEGILDAGYELDNYCSYETQRRLPYIGQLAHLKCLRLKGDLGCWTAPFLQGRSAGSLASLAILHGIATLKNLRVLVLQQARVSAVELKFLIRNMNLLRLEFIDCKVDPVSIRWLQKKRRNMALEFIEHTSKV